MKTPLKSYIQQCRANIKQFWVYKSFSDKLQLVGFFVAIIALMGVLSQLRENTKTNKVAIRGQLYQTEAALAAGEAGDDEQTLTTIWALVPPTVTGHEFSATLLRLVTEDPAAIKAKTAEELRHIMFDATTFADPKRKDTTRELRRLFLVTQTTFYHVHAAFDYKRDGILSGDEWITWKNLIREMSAHPMLITIILHGYRHRYFSREFGTFLQQELCGEVIPSDIADPETYKRGREFIRLFYPDMLKKEWPNALPDY